MSLPHKQNRHLRIQSKIYNHQFFLLRQLKIKNDQIPILFQQHKIPFQKSTLIFEFPFTWILLKNIQPLIIINIGLHLPRRKQETMVQVNEQNSTETYARKYLLHRRRRRNGPQKIITPTSSHAPSTSSLHGDSSRQRTSSTKPETTR